MPQVISPAETRTSRKWLRVTVQRLRLQASGYVTYDQRTSFFLTEAGYQRAALSPKDKALDFFKKIRGSLCLSPLSAWLFQFALWAGKVGATSGVNCRYFANDRRKKTAFAGRFFCKPQLAAETWCISRTTLAWGIILSFAYPCNVILLWLIYVV